ncbi:MAG TPA: hypothetical protein VN366_13620 [Feifaniaceae bacterium]|nr:hypothetical protein [Feifaniaceae bacterium]
MPDALFDAVQKAGAFPPPDVFMDLSSPRADREACREAFLSQKGGPYAFLCGQTQVRLFFDTDGAPLEALVSSYVAAVFRNPSFSNAAPDAGAPRP